MNLLVLVLCLSLSISVSAQSKKILPLVVNKESYIKAKSAEFGIVSVELIHGYVLKVKVLHQAGCGKYKFNMIWNETFIETQDNR